MNLPRVLLSAFAPVSALLFTTSPLSSAVIAHWAFDEGSGVVVADDSGNALNGTLTGSCTWVEDRLGNAGQAVSFGTNSGWMDVSDAIKGTSMTLAGWVNIASASSSSPNPIFSSETGNGATNFSYRLSIPSDRRARLEIVAPEGAGGSVVVDSAVGFIDYGTWYHIAGTFGDGVASLYVNGELLDSVSYTGTVNTSASIPVAVGHLQNWSVQWINGTLDEMVVYNEALDATAIHALYAVPEPSETAAFAGLLVIAVTAFRRIRQRRA